MRPVNESAHTAENAAAFRSGFDTIYGNMPFPWQARLFQHCCRGDIPAALDLPTGLGKTSVMAIWLLARALADPTVRERLPRRWSMSSIGAPWSITSPSWTSVRERKPCKLAPI
jgi:hypothetical protein